MGGQARRRGHAQRRKETPNNEMKENLSGRRTGEEPLHGGAGWRTEKRVLVGWEKRGGGPCGVGRAEGRLMGCVQGER